MLRKMLFIVSVFSLALISFQPGYQALAQTSPDQVLIFADGFESGNLSAWSAKVKDGSDLAVTSGSALVGTRGLRAKINDNHRIYIQDNSPNNEAIYDAQFHFDPNSIVMADKNVHYIFLGYDFRNQFVPALRVQLRFFGGAYQIRAGSRNDNLTTWSNTRWFNISDAEHQIEIEWDGASTPGQNDGKLKFKIDDNRIAIRLNLDNDTFRIDRVRLGAVFGIDNGTRGIYFFDQFESYR